MKRKMRMVPGFRMIQGIFVGALVIGAAGGCASIKDHRGYLADSALVDSVQPGIDNKLSVERSLGRPTFVSQFGDPAWYYVSIDTKQAPFSRPKTDKQMVMRVRFDPAGNVLAVDKAGTEQIASIDPEGRITPTLGRDRNLLQDLFGNIGSVGAPGMSGSSAPTPGTGPNGS